MLPLTLALIVSLTAPDAPATKEQSSIQVQSPGKTLTLVFSAEGGTPTYQVSRLGKPVVQKSRLGFRLKNGLALDGGFKIASNKITDFDQTWEQPWGEQRAIRDRHRELAVQLEGISGAPRKLEIVFRVFDDGIGFRYRIPVQAGLDAIEIADELTEFAMSGDHRAWWIPAYQSNHYEYHYTDSPLTKTDKVHTPITFETSDKIYISIHEAALTDFPSMVLERREGTTFKADLVPWSDDVKARGKAPMQSPWRTIQIADSPGGLIESYLILNLNEPSKLDDVSWIKPGKYVGIWWEMHLNKSTWHSGPKHGATTENTKRHIDFAARNGFDGALVEGWNKGWDGDWLANGDLFSFTEPYPDYDLNALAAYARQRGVTLIGHHETAGGIENYERQLESAYSLCEKLGIRIVKTGYVKHGRSIERTDDAGKKHKEFHYGQFMVRHFQKVLDAAARHHVMLDVHEPIKDTGLRRTYPNMMTCEGACGQEFDAWGGVDNNPPDHTTIIPFTRLLAGPMDFTRGIFKLTYEDLRPGNRVHTTLAKQLALYVVIYSPFQMAADLLENYEANPEPFQFIKDVPTDWETTKVIDAAIGDFVTIARKDRRSDDWYVGSITDENERRVKIPLSFLDSNRKYVAEIYRDGDDAEWKEKPYSIVIEKQDVTSMSSLAIRLGPSGSAAIRVHPANQDPKLKPGQVISPPNSDKQHGTNTKPRLTRKPLEP